MAVHELVAYLCVTDTAKAIEFYTKTFGAREKMRLTEPSGRIGHAEVDFDGTTLMVSDEFPELGITGPRLEREPTDDFYGERSGVIRDPFGHRWNIGHQIEQVDPDEMQRRYTRLLQSSSVVEPKTTIYRQERSR